MRWYFPDPNDADEQAERERTLAAIASWWKEFTAEADGIREMFAAGDQDRMGNWLPHWIEDHLLAIHPCLMWEFGPAGDDRDRLTITPESRHDLRPLVRKLLSRAPKLDGWKFTGHRPALDVESALSTTKWRMGVDLSRVTVGVAPGELNDVDLTFRIEPSREAHHAAFVATEYLVGEAALDRWIGIIEVQGKLPVGATPHPIAAMKQGVKTAVGAIQAALPIVPYFELERDGKGGVLTATPGEVDEDGDFPGCMDTLTGNSPWPDLWIALRSPSFESARYSRHGEKFAYVKIDGHEWPGHGEASARGVIEDAVDADLRAAGLGCVVGGATGLRYSYFHVALTKIREGALLIRDRLSSLDLPSRTWVLFHDRDLEAEWIGVRPDTPAPPMHAERS